MNRSNSIDDSLAIESRIIYLKWKNNQSINPGTSGPGEHTVLNLVVYIVVERTNRWLDEGDYALLLRWVHKSHHRQFYLSCFRSYTTSERSQNYRLQQLARNKYECMHSVDIQAAKILFAQSQSPPIDPCTNSGCKFTGCTCGNKCGCHVEKSYPKPSKCGGSENNDSGNDDGMDRCDPCREFKMKKK